MFKTEKHNKNTKLKIIGMIILIFIFAENRITQTAEIKINIPKSG